MDTSTANGPSAAGPRYVDLLAARATSARGLFDILSHDVRRLSSGRILVARDTTPDVGGFMPIATMRPSPEAGPPKERRLKVHELWCRVLLKGRTVRLESNGRWGAWLAAVLAYRLGVKLSAQRADTRTSPPPVPLSFYWAIADTYGDIAVERYGVEWARFFTLDEAR
jgi:hypothetical protein